MRSPAVAALVVATGLLGSCGVTHAGGRPWWSQSGSCGSPAVVRLPGHVLNVGTCAGSLQIPASVVTLDVGQQIDVHMTEEADPSGNRMVPVIPLPRSSRVSVVAPGAIGADRATETYRAVRPGRAVLMSHTQACFLVHHRKPGTTTGSCPVVEITVVP